MSSRIQVHRKGRKAGRARKKLSSGRGREGRQTGPGLVHLVGLSDVFKDLDTLPLLLCHSQDLLS